MTTEIVVRNNCIYVNGIQQGITFSTHQLALREGKTFHARHYPEAIFREVLPNLIAIFAVMAVLVMACNETKTMKKQKA